MVRRLEVLLLVGVMTLAACGETISEKDPLAISNSDGQTISGMHAGPEQLIAYGYNVMVNKGTAPITDISASLVSSNKSDLSVQFQQVLVSELDTHRLGFLGVGPWPFKEIPLADTSSLNGYVLKPDGKRVELLFIIRVTGQRGRANWGKTLVEYVSKGKKYKLTVENGLMICAPVDLSCDPQSVTPSSISTDLGRAPVGGSS